MAVNNKKLIHIFVVIITAYFIFFQNTHVYAAYFTLPGNAGQPAGFTRQTDLPPVYGDAKVEGSIGEPSNLIPALSTDSASSQLTSRMYVRLLKYGKDLNIEKEAAEAYEVLDDGLRLKFTLRRDLQWVDGMPITVNDVEFTYRLMIDEKTPTAYAGDYLRVKEFKKLDDYSFEVSYEKPYARSLISWMIEILPRHALEGQDLHTTPQRRNPVTSGPFRLKSWEAGSRVTLTANDRYFEGRPYLDALVMRIIPDLTTMFLELRAGKLDAMGLTPQQYVYQTANTAFAEQYAVYRYLALGYTFIGYNLKSPLFSDKRVRQAFAHAINKEDIISGVLFGQGMPTIGPYMPGTWVYNDHITPYEYNLDKAAGLLAECGWIKDADGILRKDGRAFAFTILVNQGNEQRVKIAVVAQSQLKKLGITARIRTVEWAAFLNDFVNKGFFDALILGWSTTLDPDLHSVWHSSNNFEGGLNFIGYSNALVDGLIEEGRSTFDEETRKKCYLRIQEILHDEQPYSFLYVPYAFSAVSKRFKGLEPKPVQGVDHNLPLWWVPQEQQLYRNFLEP